MSRKGVVVSFIAIGAIAIVIQQMFGSPDSQASNNQVKCGIMNELHPDCAMRINNGRDCPKKYPWIVSLHRFSDYYANRTEGDNLYNSHLCAGTLIAPQWIVTAAHCAYVPICNDHDCPRKLYKRHRNPNELLVNFGNHKLEDPPAGDPSRFLVNVTRIIIHKKYVDCKMPFDIALLKLESPVQYTTNIRPICLPDEDFDEKGKDFLVTGWGCTHFDNKTSQTLKEVNISHVPDDICSNHSMYENKITEYMFCAGKAENGTYKDSNKGDSGGGLVYINSNTMVHTLAGIVSYGYKYKYDDGRCSVNPNVPGIYTKVSKFLDFINDNVYGRFAWITVIWNDYLCG